jgi:bidirectional [NiFe] hydrogenase diaphorase subunit
MVRDTSLCGLGQTAPNPMLSALRYFGDEFHRKLRQEPRGGTTRVPLKLL